MSKAKTTQSRLNYCQAQLENLKNINIAAQAQALGFALDDQNRAAVNFLGRELLVDNQGVAGADGKSVIVDAKSVVAHLMASSGRGELMGVYVPIGRLTGISVTSGSPSEKLSKPLSDKFGDRYDLFKQAAEKIGGTYAGISSNGAQAWDFGLPKLPVRVEFFEADDEFDAEIKLLFDQSANRFVSYECLELLTMCVVVELLMAAGLINDPEDCQSSFL
ncbi:MAG: DUF3786 domain-containing protein [Deltaproteobacteria bacterium]|jgi:hypothetical protein|nr:DUF3786 domain-containing protein [Deltaproteobacteria bacterium]